MPRAKIITIDCETDPFKHGRVPKPFIWGAYDGETFLYWRDTIEFLKWLSKQKVIAYAHNGGKFDFMFLLPLLKELGLAKSRVKIINGRFAEMSIGFARLRDSFSIVPVALGKIKKTEVNYDLFEENVREDHMDTVIIPYLHDDCRDLLDVVIAYRNAAGKPSRLRQTP
jgi:hypothetical protein